MDELGTITELGCIECRARLKLLDVGWNITAHHNCTLSMWQIVHDKETK